MKSAAKNQLNKVIRVAPAFEKINVILQNFDKQNKQEVKTKTAP